MKKMISRIVCMALALMMILIQVPVIRTDAEEPTQPQVWTDDFSSGKGSSYTANGWWWNMDGVLTVGDERAGAGVCYYWLNDLVWDDFVMEFDVINQTSEFGVILRAQQTTPDDCQNFGYGILSDTNWAFFMAENGYFANFDAMAAAGNATAVEGIPTATQPGAQNVHWKIVAKGNRIEVYFNGATTPSMAMDANLWSSGAIGFRTFNPGGAVTAVIDNLSITQILPEPEPEPEPTPSVQTWTDDFSSGKGGSYTPHGWWWNMDGVLTVGDERAGAGVCYYWLNDLVWDDFVMEFDVINQTSEFGVIFRAQQTTADDCQNQGYGVVSDTNWAFFMAENGAFTAFDALVAAGSASAVEDVPTAAQPGTQNAHWKIVAKDNRIEVYFNGAETPSMAMDATLWSSGAIGFRTFNPGGAVTAVIDNLVITEIEETDEPEDPITPDPDNPNPDDPDPDDPNPDDPDPDDPNPDNPNPDNPNPDNPNPDNPNPDDPDPDDPNPDDPDPDDPNPDDPNPDDPNPDDPNPDDPDPDDPDTPVVPSKPIKTWTDDFSSDKGGFYTPYGYWWNMDGKLTVGDANAMPGVCYYWLPGMVWDDFVMEFDVDSQSSEFGVILRAQKMTPDDCQNQGIGVLSDTAWAFFMAEDGSFKTFDQLKAEGKASSVDNYPWACQPGSKNVHWKIVAKGDTVSVYFNHASSPSMVMKTSLWKSGYIGFRTNNPGGAITAIVDNLTITNSDIPNTSDAFQPVMMALAAGSGLGLAALTIPKKRKKQ